MFDLVGYHKNGFFPRVCPKCGSPVIHKDFYARNISQLAGKVCRHCNLNALHTGPRPDFKGENNPFFGKKHSNTTKVALKNKDTSYMKLPEFSASVRNGMDGNTNRRPVYDCWLDKYGKEGADRRLASLKSKHSANQSGSGNSMFGVPAPRGAGNGWKGWIDGHYFRSLRELSFMLANQDWQSAESKEFSVKYVDRDGKTRTYFPDFFVPPNAIFECKPVKLWESPSVSLKSTAARAWFSARGMTYELIDPPLVSIDMVMSMIQSGRIRFEDRYHDKFLEYRRQNG